MTSPETLKKRELKEAFDAGICFAMTCEQTKEARPAERGFNEWLESARMDLVEKGPRSGAD